MAQQNVTAVAGTPILTLLAVSFVILKLVGHIDWSWWYVLAPVWAPFALVGFLFLLSVICLGISKLFD